MNELAHYIRLHLTGAASGIELFSRGKNQHDQHAREVIGRLREELRDERQRLLALADSLDVRPAPLATLVAKAGERAARLKPNGHLVKRTAMSDLVDLEAMRIAVAGKISGWEAMLAAAENVDGLDRAELTDLHAQGCRQFDQLVELHGAAAKRALTPH